MPLLHALVLASVVGTVLGLLAAGLRLLELPVGRGLVAARFVHTGVVDGFLATGAALLVGALLVRLTRGLVRDERRRVQAVFLLLWLGLVGLLLHRLEGGLLARWSAAACWGTLAALGLALAALGVVGARGLSAWCRRDLTRPPRAGLAALLLVPLAFGLERLDRGRHAGPDVFVLLVDVLRADHLGCYGYERETSPNIDRLAADSVLFEQMVSQSTFTKTSVASLFSGLYPHHHRVYRGGPTGADPREEVLSDTLGGGIHTLAETLAADGFLTVAWVENPQLRAYMGFDQGFAVYHDQPGEADVIRREFLDWISGWGESNRVFAYLHFLDLHGPYDPHPPYDTRFGTHSDRFEDMSWRDWRRYKLDVQDGSEPARDADLEQLRALYDGALSFVDEEVGRILDGLREAGLYDDALIVLTADHGEAFLEHGFLAHSATSYEELVRVPLIVKLPGGELAGSRVGEQVALVDVLPTVLEVAGARDVAERDGTSLVPLMRTGVLGVERDHVFSELQNHVAVRTSDWKYIQFADGEPQLYHLAEDPGETHDVSAEHPELLAYLRSLAEASLAERKEGEAGRVVVDEATVQELKALGYL